LRTFHDDAPPSLPSRHHQHSTNPPPKASITTTSHGHGSDHSGSHVRNRNHNHSGNQPRPKLQPPAWRLCVYMCVSHAVIKFPPPTYTTYTLMQFPSNDSFRSYLLLLSWVLFAITAPILLLRAVSHHSGGISQIRTTAGVQTCTVGAPTRQPRNHLRPSAAQRFSGVQQRCHSHAAGQDA